MRNFNRFIEPNQYEYTPRAQREMDEQIANQIEAFTLLDLIEAEFRSDPMSTQCFDARIVERVRMCVAKRQKRPL